MIWETGIHFSGSCSLIVASSIAAKKPPDRNRVGTL